MSARHLGQDVLAVCDRIAKHPTTIDDQVADLLTRRTANGGAGTLELDFRARLVTALRERKLWPKEFRR